MRMIYCILIGYFIGTINPSYIIARLRGFDIRERGSKNAGASNALINFGKAVGVACAIFDILKATGAVLLSEALTGGYAYALPITAVSCIIGHIFPFYMRFRGGKGLACLGGAILAFDIRVFLIMLGIAIVIALMTDYICFVPITASVAFPIVYGVMRSDLFGALILCAATAVMLIKHTENIRRILAGREMHLSYLWKKDEETERMKNAGGE